MEEKVKKSKNDLVKDSLNDNSIFSAYDEDMESKSSKRIKKLQAGKVKVHFSIPNSLGKMLDEDAFPEFYKALYYTLLNSVKDNDSSTVSRSISLDEIKSLKEFIINLDSDSQAKNDSKGLLKQLTSVIELVVNGKKRKVGYLRNLPAAVYAFLMEDYIDGWMYRIDSSGNPLAHLVTEVSYVTPFSHDSKPFVHFEFMYHSMGGRKKLTFDIDANEIRGRTVSEVLYSQNGLLHESEELKDMYKKSNDLFNKYRTMEYAQFTVTGSAAKNDGWRKEKISLSTDSTPYGLALNDEGSKDKVSLNFEASNYFWIDNFNSEEEAFTKIPVHPFIYMFHLGYHEHMYISSKDMVPYVYDESIGEKLILPESHKELISILTEDQDILVDDIISGKGAGTIILCKGIPGVGKTLSAQVYSEVMKKPLYNINAGQLGITVESLEKNLKMVMDRAERWGAVLLIDEADVYIKERGDDVHHNALVAVWLRTIEYFNGLMFLTTNRGDDVDDAIASRCIATISYRAPEHDESIKIWKIMCQNAGLKISVKTAEKLTSTFPNAVGRDIEKLVKLTVRFAAKKGIKPEVSTFIHCAAFRGMVSVN